MLKRQRPSSPPPPPSSSTTLSPFDTVLPFSKRRRVLPHSLDSPLESTRVQVHWEDDEEYTDEHKDDDCRPVATDSPYKETNSVLYELHTLHRHRLLFSPPQQQLGTQKPLNSVDSALHTNHTSHTQPESQPMSPISSHRHLSDHNLLEHRKYSSRGNLDSDPDLEVHSVRERYEETNRLLGSLFLSRRQELKDDEKESPHR